MTDTLNIVVTRDQAERLLALVDAENAAQKNRCVSALNSNLENHPERVDTAVRLAGDSEYLTTLRSNLARRLGASVIR